MIATRRLRKTVALLAPLALAAFLFSVWGCNPHKDQIRPENIFGRIGRQNGEILEPRKCAIRVAIIDRPHGDNAINQVAWKAADEQEIPLEVRRALEANGVKVGEITGELPVDLESVLNAPPPHKVEPASFLLDDGEYTLISLCDPVDQVSLLLNREGRAYGKDYEAASGFLRVVATHDGSNGVCLRLTPEIHHGPMQRSFPSINNGAPYSPQQFKINDGQQEETLRDLSASISLEPNQVAVFGCRPEQSRSLGAFLLTRSEAHGDQRRQRLILIWATRNQLGALGEKRVASDRPQPSPIKGPLAAKSQPKGPDSPAAASAGEQIREQERRKR